MRWARAWDVVSHLAIWPGLYIATGVVAFAQMAGMWGLVRGEPWRWGAVVGCAFCSGTSVYLLDRVKVADRWLDPADGVAHPERAAFVARYAVAVRALMVVLVVIAAVLGAAVSWWTVPMVVGACVGVVVYAGRPRGGRARPKDVLVLKNMCVAAAITAFVVVLCLLAARVDVRERAMWALVVMGSVQVLGRAFADAVLSDLDDEHADRVFATQTLATRFGRERAWVIAMVIRLILAGVLLAAPMGAWRVRLAWAVVTAVSTLALRMARPSRVRDWVDARFALEAAIVAIVV